MKRPVGSPIRIGVLGAGWFSSRRHLPDITANRNATLAAICRRNPEELAKIQTAFPTERIFTDWRRMLDEADLDAVLIATPHSLHFEQAQAALERGLHVLIEKPMTVRSDHARELLELATDKNLLISTTVNPPFWGHCHYIRDTIRSGRLGDLESIAFYWSGNAGYVFHEAPAPENLPGTVPPTMYRADPELCGGGYFIDGGPHLVSQLLWTTAQRATSVTCRMDTLPSDRRASLIVELESGAAATISCIGDSQLGDRRVRNTYGGSAGTISIDGFDFRVTVAQRGKPEEQRTEKELPQPSGPVDNFVSALLGKDELLSPPAHGVHVVEVVEAAYLSAKEGRTIQLTS
jgi:predicted dehydrogenase